MFDFIIKRFKKIVIRILALMFFLIFLFMIFLYLNYRLKDQYPNPDKIYSYVEDNKTSIYLNEKNKEFLKEKDIWAIRINKNGKIVESFNKPKEVKNKFDLTDVAGFTRYYLADYPVFTYILKDGLILFAYPKNSLDKFPFNYYNFKNLLFNFEMFLVFVILFFIFVYIFYRIDIKNIFKNILPLQEAIDKIYEDDYEKLDESGELKDLALSINKANEKYNNLKKSQSKWIRGLSHDVRTPLAKISWELSKKNKNDLDTRNIQDQVLKISNILEGLNLTMSLANIDKENFESKSPLKVIRKVIVDKLNENPKREIIFENRLRDPDIKLKMDPTLFYRMVENIIKNSLAYTEGKIDLIISNPDNQLIIRVLDQGCGVDEDIIKRINDEDLTNITRHGLGIFISKQIAELHDGKFSIENKDQGLDVSFIFDLIN
ncbi:ATPase/histidine kinase/DNA gyrase B/HSP90 domain protein [Finegoldia magna SY403409CC001050417]|uniref:histidine kinase n=1 Tax=Finegoldia magna TaxID=1260 RepID=A0A7D4FUF6_FINMA|nr:HAMP domain-containing sensor histidine kinase [Finegoldia magna]EGS35155.1 ATPase/histidine kinase/DNA gyrase B/HSP90 domain protein [Finegoldia magna SY403409CC001050417]QKH78855.1 HAMP domain-containing histidine kinase [Finegoldia magna]